MNKEYKSPDMEVTFLDNDTNALLVSEGDKDENKDWTDPVMP